MDEEIYILTDHPREGFGITQFPGSLNEAFIVASGWGKCTIVYWTWTHWFSKVGPNKSGWHWRVIELNSYNVKDF